MGDYGDPPPLYPTNPTKEQVFSPTIGFNVGSLMSPSFAPSAPPDPGLDLHEDQTVQSNSYMPQSSQLTVTPTVVPADYFDPQDDANILRRAIKSFGTDEKAIINVLTKRSNAQRLEIADQFKALYDTDLINLIQRKLGGNFAKTIIALITPLPQFYAKELHDVLSGEVNDETVLVEVLCTLNNAEIKAIKEAYHCTYRNTLKSHLKDDTRVFRRLMFSLCNAERDESMAVDPLGATADAEALYNAEKEHWGSIDEYTFHTILCQRNYSQLKLIFQEYHKISKHDIEKTIKREFSGDRTQEGLFLDIVSAIKSPQGFLAKCLHNSMKGLGTNNRDLIRVVVTRCEKDMKEIKREYLFKNHGESLADAIREDTSGDYKRCLLALIGEA